MNSDPFDSAAWRTFNMLDAEESVIFDEAMRDDPALHSAAMEMDRLSAALAASLAQPVDPKPGHLDRLQARLGLAPAHHTHYWSAVIGWSVAAALGILLTFRITGITDQRGTPPPVFSTTPPGADTTTQVTYPTVKDQDSDNQVKVETKRLNQEIEVLRDNLEKLQNRDRTLSEIVPGVAVPIVMMLNPPGMALEDSAPVTRIEEHSPLTSLLGDALTTLTGAAAEDSPTGQAAVHTSFPDHPVAVSIYDTARDAGTLVANDLPPAAANEAYNLWVTIQASDKPIFVGRLPESCVLGTSSFDFILGSTSVLPTCFILTRDPLNVPASPTVGNTVLRGPSTSSH